MARSSTSFAVGHPGKQPGTKNKKTMLAIEYAQKFLKDAAFQQVVREILRDPTHDKWQFMVELLFAYAWGKPTEHLHQTSDGTVPAAQYQIAWLDYDQFFTGDNGSTPAREGSNGARHPAGL